MAFRISWSCAPGPVGVSFQGSWIDRGPGQTLSRHCPTLPGHRGCWHLNLLMAILLLQHLPRTVSVVTAGRHLAPCSPPRHTMTDTEELLHLSPSCSSTLNARRCSHSQGAQALLHCSGFAILYPCAPDPPSPASHHVPLCCWASFFPC